MLSSAVDEVIPSSLFNSVAVAVTPSRMFSSAAVAVTDVLPNWKVPVKFVVPETVRAVRVPTLVREELTTAEPRVVALSTEALAILYSLPVTRSKDSEGVQLSVELIQLIVLSVAPFSVIPPPSAVVSEGVSTAQVQCSCHQP